MKKSTLLPSTGLLLLGACSWFDHSGSKAEANAVSRRYNRPSTEVWSALTAALQTLELRIDADRHDALGGELTARRATKDSIHVLVKSLDETSAQVSISIGDGDRNLAE